MSKSAKVAVSLPKDILELPGCQVPYFMQGYGEEGHPKLETWRARINVDISPIGTAHSGVKTNFVTVGEVIIPRAT